MSEISRQPRASVPPRPGAKKGPGSRQPYRSAPGPRTPAAQHPGQSGRPERRRVRPRSPRSARERRRRIRLALGAGLVVVVALGALLVAYATEGTGTSPSAISGTFAIPENSLRPLQATSPAALRGALTASPNSASPLIELPSSVPPLASNGKPELLYIGANYCPYCAAERWALLVALSKFGTFSSLRGTTSSTTDINPATPSVTFAGSRFSSRYLSFVPVETHGNVARADGTYPVLEKLTPQQAELLQRYDAAPYVPPSGAGGIPFLDLAGRYLFVGSQYDAAKIAGWDWGRATAYLGSGTNATSQGLRVAAAYLVRDICRVTGGMPRAACS